jgi:metal-responsive CopG/Arc/MetJ family transcriptional regulator
MKTFSAMSHGDLIIIRDALRQVIARHTEIKVYKPGTIAMEHEEFKGCIEEILNHVNHERSRITRIGELLDAINEALHQDDSK